MQDKGQYIRFAPSQQKNCCLERCFLSCYFRILNNLHAHNPSNRFYSLYHQHNPSFSLNKHIGIATNYRINLIGCNWLSILADMQLLAVNNFCNLLGPHSSVLAGEAVKYGFFDFHKLMAISYLARFLLLFLIEFTKS